jgi:RHS repeat-associated protein
VGSWDGVSWTYYLPDALGSVRQLADERGNVVQTVDYSPFGQVTAVDGERADPYRFAGEHWDADAGLLYLRARWYNPATGRFLSQDPFPGLPALPQTLNPYLYVLNDPVNLVDPTGEIPFVVLPIISIPLLLGGTAFVLDWAWQVAENICHDDRPFLEAFWDAVYHENLNWNEMWNVGTGVALTTFFAMGVVAPVVIEAASLAALPAASWLGHAGYIGVSNWLFGASSSLYGALVSYTTWLWMGITSASAGISTTRPSTPSRSEVVQQYGGEYNCDECASAMSWYHGDSVVTIQNYPIGTPLNDPPGIRMGGAKGWHVGTIDPEGIWWDNFGAWGPAEDYLLAAHMANPSAEISAYIDYAEAGPAIEWYIYFLGNDQ